MENLIIRFDCSALEKGWTYKCVGDRCVREVYVPDTKRIPFMSCAMICGNIHIWPMPNGLISLNSHSLTFDSNQIKFTVQSAFRDAKQLLMNAYDIFDVDLKLMERRKPHTEQNDYQTNEENSNRNNKNSNTKPNCDINKFLINAEIQSIADIDLNMEMDESYELNVTSE